MKIRTRIKTLNFFFYLFWSLYFITGLALLCSPLSGCSGCTAGIEKEVTVLSINEHVLDGQMIGHFLGSADGYLTEVNLVGVRVDFQSHMFLVDLKLNHAELAYFKDRNTLPIKWETDTFNSKVTGQLNERVVVTIPVTRSLVKELHREFKACTQ